VKLSCFRKTVWQNSFTNNFMHEWEREMRRAMKATFSVSPLSVALLECKKEV
jgi:hypothetical protein